MTLKMIQLVLYSVFALTTTCQGLTNGNFVCGTSIKEVGNYDTCSTTDYNSALRYQQFGIDCCVEEAREGMKEFFRLFQKMGFGSLKDATPDALLKTCNPVDSEEVQTTTDNTDSVFMQFSSTCKRYTDVMALKNQLRCHVFNSKLTTDTASQLTELVIKLQTAAVNLQNIEQESGSSCVEFTARQYYHIYQSRFEEDVVKSLIDRSYTWGTSLNSCCVWGQYE